MLISLAHHSNIMTTPGQPSRRKTGSRASDARHGRTNGSRARSCGAAATVTASSPTESAVEAASAAAAPCSPAAGTRRLSRHGWRMAAAPEVTVCTLTMPCA